MAKVRSPKPVTPLGYRQRHYASDRGSRALSAESDEQFMPAPRPMAALAAGTRP
jgi:hypothetical protein